MLARNDAEVRKIGYDANRALPYIAGDSTPGSPLLSPARAIAVVPLVWYDADNAVSPSARKWNSASTTTLLLKLQVHAVIRL